MKERETTYEEAMEMLLKSPDYVEELAKDNPKIREELAEYQRDKAELAKKNKVPNKTNFFGFEIEEKELDR